MSFYYHVCPSCARSYRNVSKDTVQHSKDRHECKNLLTGMRPTMRPFEEYEWATDQLKKAGGVAV